MENVTSVDLLNIFKNESEFLAKCYIRIDSFPIIQYDCLCKLYQNSNLRKSFIKALENNENKKWAGKSLKKLLSVKNAEGTFHELLAYAWFTNNAALYKQDVKTVKGQTLSKSTPTLDGRFDFGSKRTYFDIKTFNIPNNILEQLIYKLSNEPALSQYMFMIEGKRDCSYKLLEKKILNLYEDIKNDIISRSISEQQDFYYHIENTPITIKVIRKREGVHMSTCTFSPYRWAEENELFFIKNASQFTNNNPFLLICVCGAYSLSSPEIQLRSIARRAFIRLPKIKVNEVSAFLDGKVHNKYTKGKLKIIMRRLSGILFIEYKGTDINEMKGYLYINPNAKSPIKNYQSLLGFNQNLKVVDNFKNDNY